MDQNVTQSCMRIYLSCANTIGIELDPVIFRLRLQEQPEHASLSNGDLLTVHSLCTIYLTIFYCLHKLIQQYKNGQ